MNISKKYKCVILDLDGTTLNNNHELTNRTVDVLQKLSSIGVLIVIATGRSTPTVKEYAKKMSLSQSIIPMTCFNGAIGFNYKIESDSLQSVYSAQISLNLAKELIDFANNLELVVQYYNGESGEVLASPKNDNHRELLKRYEKLTGRAQTVVSNYDELLNSFQPAKLLIMCNDADEVIELYKKKFPNNDLHYIRGSPFPFFVEFLNKSTNKGVCVKALVESHGIDMSVAVAFGDGENDAEMLKFAGLGIAMANAKQLAKDSADYILPFSNDEDGVAIQLENMLDSNQFEKLS